MSSDADRAGNRTYLHIRPTADAPAGDRVSEQFKQLHAAVDGPVECLLVADPAIDEIQYYLGCHKRTLPSLDRVLARLLPDTYAIERTETDPLPTWLSDTTLPDESADDTTAETATADDEIAAVELHGVGRRHDDWQTRLRPPSTSNAPEQHQTPRVAAAPGLPLTSLIEGMQRADTPVVYQALIRPKRDWSFKAEDRIWKLEHNEDTWGDRLFKFIFGPTDDYQESSNQSTYTAGGTGRRQDTYTRTNDSTTASGEASLPGSRINAIRTKSQTHSFEVNARLLATGPNATRTLENLGNTFDAIGGDYYSVLPAIYHGSDATALADDVRDRTVRTADGFLSRLRKKFPLAGNHDPAIVADATTLPHFLLFDGASLSESARTTVRALPSERTGLPVPSEDILSTYDEGFAFGRVRARDGTTTDRELALPTALQLLHILVIGKSGSGKSLLTAIGLLYNQAVTDGPDILVDPKGDGLPEEYCRMHYAKHGDLEDVYYFDCTETVPALTFFDVRPYVEAGIPRSTAVETIADHYVEILREVDTSEGFDRSVRAADIIRHLITALFDPEHGADAFEHRDLLRAVNGLLYLEEPPQVRDPELAAMLERLVENTDQTFTELMQAVAGRVEKVTTNTHLATLFNHVPDDEAASQFDLEAFLDEDAVVILDTGGLRSHTQRAVTLVVLSALWTALKRRERRAGNTTEPPLVNLYLEEAASLGVSQTLQELLSQSRGFGLSVMLGMQFPEQLRQAGPGGEAAYAELLNEVSTILAGNVPVDDRLARRFATDDMPPEKVANRLRALERGQWLCTLPAPFGEPEPRPFQVESLPLPDGHPESDSPLEGASERGFEALFAVTREQTQDIYGLDVTDDATAATDADDRRGDDPMTGRARVDSALPHTEVMPDAVRYTPEAHAVVCSDCGVRYDPDVEGLKRAIDCCHDLDSVDRDKFPITDVSLTLSADERADSPYSDAQLMFLQAVFAAHQQQYDADWEYDIVRDSMTLLREYIGIDGEAVQDLVDAGLLRVDCRHPHKLYTVTADGRSVIEASYRKGVSFGDGRGDLSESSLHVAMVELLRRYIERAYVDDPASDVEAVQTYYELDDGRRLDVAGLDGEGEIVITAEAERTNHDALRAVPEDYDTMAACEPAEAIWLTRARDDAHDVLAVLNEPRDGEPRVEKAYSETTMPHDFRIDEPGCTAIHTFSYVRDTLLAEAPTH